MSKDESFLEGLKEEAHKSGNMYARRSLSLVLYSALSIVSLMFLIFLDNFIYPVSPDPDEMLGQTLIQVLLWVSILCIPVLSVIGLLSVRKGVIARENKKGLLYFSLVVLILFLIGFSLMIMIAINDLATNLIH